jgi:ankyrin repeat protein
MTEHEDLESAFIRAACVPRDRGHKSGTLEQANALLAAHPDLTTRSIHAAAVLGDGETVRRFVAADPGSATAKGGPYGWDALTHLCFSRYLRLDRARSDGFLHAATALLDAGADPNTGWFEHDHEPKPEWESAIYGAAGVAQQPALARLLLERGADPNDGETPYHVIEADDNTTLHVVVESGKLDADSLATILLRKCDWHDLDGVVYVLEHGADPNRGTRWRGRTAIHQSVLRDNDLAIVEALLAHGADPSIVCDVGSAVQIAARRGRGDVLDAFERRGVPVALGGVDALLAACARHDDAAIRALVGKTPGLVGDLRAQGGARLAEFAGTANTEGVRRLLDLGVPVTAIYEEGDGYYSVAQHSTALHVAAWRARHGTVKLLIERGAPIDAKDGRGRTALQLAVLATVDSYWKWRRTPESVKALLDAGASADGVKFPTGYDEVDELLRAHGATPQ